MQNCMLTRIKKQTAFQNICFHLFLENRYFTSSCKRHNKWNNKLFFQRKVWLICQCHQQGGKFKCIPFNVVFKPFNVVWYGKYNIPTLLKWTMHQDTCIGKQFYLNKHDIMDSFIPCKGTETITQLHIMCFFFQQKVLFSYFSMKHILWVLRSASASHF